VVSLITLAVVLQASIVPAETVSVPQAPDIGSALSDHWVRISSTGMSLHDYIVRGVRCVPVSLDQKYTEPAKDNPLDTMTDKAVSQVRCSYQYATKISRKADFSKLPRMKRKPRLYSAHEIARIPEKLWRQEERDFVRLSRTPCLYMSRTPLPGECDDYWAVLL
jgi:hypothetical protein